VDQFERPGASTAGSPPGEVETDNVEKPPGPPESHPETIPEPMAMEFSTDSLVPAPDPEETGMEKRVEASQQPRTVFGIVEVGLGWIERIVRQFTAWKIAIGCR